MALAVSTIFAVVVNASAHPLVSIITVVRNGASTLAETLSSVRAQTYPHIEHVIVDGASTDGTPELVHSFNHPRLHFLSEADRGIYDAMNKGISRAQGQWLLFLGADDRFVDDDVLADVFAKPVSPDCVALIGSSNFLDGRKLPAYLGWRTLVFNTLHHQAVLYHRCLFDKFRYRAEMTVMADYELNLMIYLRRMNVQFVPRLISLCGSAGISQRTGLLATQWDSYRIRATQLSPLVNIVLTCAGIGNALLAFVLRWRS